MTVRPHPECAAGADGLKCRHPGYVYVCVFPGPDGMWLCVDHWKFWQDVSYDVDTLYQVTLYDWEQE